MPLNHYLTLGRSGLRVSPMCLGTMTFGEDLGWGSSVKDSEAIMDRYIDRGGNFLDTANVYTFGHSEKIIGDHIGRHAGKRDRLVIATKFFGNLFPNDPNGGGAGRKAILSACNESLRRLQTDYIDLYWMHAWDANTPIEETLDTFEHLIQSGKIRYVGFSDVPAWKVAEAQTIARLRGRPALAALQIEYSLLERTVEGDLMPMALEMGLGVTPWSPLKGGILSGKYTRANHGKLKADRGARVDQLLTDKTYGIVDGLVEVAKALDTTPGRVALAWLQARPGVASIITGARTMGQLDQNLDALDVKLSVDQIKQLDALSAPQLNFPAPLLPIIPSFMHGGMNVNGVEAAPSPLLPKSDTPHY